MSMDVKIEKSLEIATSIVLASIQSGKFDAKDGQVVAKFFDEIFAQVCECAGLSSEEFVKKYEQAKLEKLTKELSR